MTNNELNLMIEATENTIRDALIKLEEATLMVVDRIEIREIDWATINSKEPESLRQVHIRVSAPRAKRWL